MIVFVDVPQIDFVRLRKTPGEQHRRVARRRTELDAGRVLQNAEWRGRVRVPHDDQISNLRLAISGWRRRQVSAVLPSARVRWQLRHVPNLI